MYLLIRYTHSRQEPQQLHFLFPERGASRTCRMNFIRNNHNPPSVPIMFWTSPEFLRVGGSGEETAPSCHHELKKVPALLAPSWASDGNVGVAHMV